jgi:hypothetical protein
LCLKLTSPFLSHPLGIGTHLRLKQLLGTALPRTLAKDPLDILGEDDLALYE